MRRLAREKETADDNARRIADGHRVDALEHTADSPFVCYLVSLKTLIVKNSFKRKFFKLNRLLVLFATFGWPRQTIPPVESILENLMGQLMAFWNNFLCSRKEEEEPPLVADLWHGDTYNQLTTPPRGKNFLETPPRGPWCSSGLEHVLRGLPFFVLLDKKLEFVRVSTDVVTLLAVIWRLLSSAGRLVFCYFVNCKCKSLRWDLGCLTRSEACDWRESPRWDF